MKKYFLLINVIIGFACTSTVNKFELIGATAMSALLIDIHILEARVGKLKIKGDSVNRVYNTLERELYEKHGVDKSRYEESFSYYLTHPKKLDQIYSSVVDSLNLYQKRGYQEDQKKVELTKESPITRDSTLYKDRLKEADEFTIDK